MATKITKNDVAAVAIVELKGHQFAKPGTLAKWLDISVEALHDLIFRLSETHEIRVLELGPRLKLVMVRDFYKALMACVPMRRGLH